MAGRYLIVANQTLGGERLDAAVRERISRDERRFYVVVPMTQIEHETSSWTGGYAAGGFAAMEEDGRKWDAELDEARSKAQQRLDLMIARIKSLDGEAEGEVGVADPLEATRAVLDRDPSFDEIIVSTLPTHLSRWLKMDLPSRIARLSHAPVTSLEAENG